MSTEQPLVCIAMMAYNCEDYIAQAIEGVIMQEAKFPYQLVIGEDFSTDKTRAICEKYANEHPEKIRLLPSERNWGMLRNFFRIIDSIESPYVAWCDSDDYWTDPEKLQMQVEFLESNPDYGLVYTDVDIVNEHGHVQDDPEQNAIRQIFDRGNVFFKLLTGENFVMTCSTVFRKDCLAYDKTNEDLNMFGYDYWFWLHISMRSKIHFINKKTICYRKHSGQATHAGFQKNRKRNYYVLYDTIMTFNRDYKKALTEPERKLVFRKLLSLLYQKGGTLQMKLRAFSLLPKYYPGLSNTIQLFGGKTGRLEQTTH